jgi:thiamine-phosphate diphosphorylase
VTAVPPGSVCLVTDRRQLTPSARTIGDELVALERFLDDAIDERIDVIQIREPGVETADLAAFAGRVGGRARPNGVRILVNDRPDVAVAAETDGVHLRSDGPSIVRVRSLGPDWTIGRSVHASEPSGDRSDADYLLFGTVFSSRSKPGHPGTGLATLRAAVGSTHVPVLAIGGITPVRASACRLAGASGVAAIGVFLPEGRTPDSLGVRRAIRELRAAMRDNGEKSLLE